MLTLWILSILFVNFVDCAPMEDEILKYGIPIETVLQARAIKIMNGNTL